MSDYILMRLLAALIECEPATEGVIADDSKVGVRTVREAMRSLQARGMVYGRVHHRYSKTGRPPTVYSLTPKGRELAPYMVAALNKLEQACA